jgi:hypothetical protein
LGLLTASSVLYLRHRLQKGLLARDQAPKEEEMKEMSENFTSLEQHADLEPGIIRVTKINKVLRAIIKLTSIPKEEEYQFKKRSADLLAQWNKILANDPEVPNTADSGKHEVVTNGVNHEQRGSDNTTEHIKEAETVRESVEEAKDDSKNTPKPEEASTEAVAVQ